jgi:hypothetical protein
VALALVWVVLVAACASGGEDSASDDAASGDDLAGSPRGGECDRTAPDDAEVVPGELTVALGTVSWTDGEAPADSHAHTGPLVDDDEAHLDYCLSLSNGLDESLAVTLVMPLPGDGEEPFALVETDALTGAVVGATGTEVTGGAGAPGGAGDRVAIGAGETVALALQVPAGEAPASIRHRIAYVVSSPKGAAPGGAPGQAPDERFLETDPHEVP